MVDKRDSALVRKFFERIGLTAKDQAHIRKNWKAIQRRNSLADKIMVFLIEKTRIDGEYIALREIQRKFTKTKKELTPALMIAIHADRLIWDKKRKRVRLSYFVSEEKRYFQWLSENTVPKDWFMPPLEKGMIYSMANYHPPVVDEWVKTRHAQFVKM